ncbi:MAG: hypothetical protein JW709_13020 [Sedimentisphaerales bacterium]|nr:hypothetical protein [Sedimentisphaerales bacterium]
MILLVLVNLMLLGLSRLRTCIRVVAIQGVMLGVLPLILNGWRPEPHLISFSLVIIGLKGIVFPAILIKLLRDLKEHREVEPFIGFGTSMAAGVVMLVVSLAFGAHLPLPGTAASSLVAPVAFFTIMTGLFLIISRKKALTQVLGYLVLENGISCFGAILVEKQPTQIELGILLDVFVAVFVMGIAIFHINREFDHIDTDKLTRLRT